MGSNSTEAQLVSFLVTIHNLLICSFINQHNPLCFFARRRQIRRGGGEEGGGWWWGKVEVGGERVEIGGGRRETDWLKPRPPIFCDSPNN